MDSRPSRTTDRQALATVTCRARCRATRPGSCQPSAFRRYLIRSIRLDANGRSLVTSALRHTFWHIVSVAKYSAEVCVDSHLLEGAGQLDAEIDLETIFNSGPASRRARARSGMFSSKVRTCSAVTGFVGPLADFAVRDGARSALAGRCPRLSQQLGADLRSDWSTASAPRASTGSRGLCNHRPRPVLPRSAGQHRRLRRLPQGPRSAGQALSLRGIARAAVTHAPVGAGPAHGWRSKVRPSGP